MVMVEDSEEEEERGGDDKMNAACFHSPGGFKWG